MMKRFKNFNIRLRFTLMCVLRRCDSCHRVHSANTRKRQIPPAEDYQSQQAYTRSAYYARWEYYLIEMRIGMSVEPVPRLQFRTLFFLRPPFYARMQVTSRTYPSSLGCSLICFKYVSLLYATLIAAPLSVRSNSKHLP